MIIPRFVDHLVFRVAELDKAECFYCASQPAFTAGRRQPHVHSR